MSCDPEVQYKIVLILQSDWTRHYGGTLHKLIYALFQTLHTGAKESLLRRRHRTIHGMHLSMKSIKDEANEKVIIIIQK